MSAVRRRYGFTSMVALCVLAAGCTTSVSPDPAATPTPTGSLPSAASPSPVSLTFAVYGPPGANEAYDAMAEAYTERNPHVSIEVRHASTAKEALAELQTDYAAGDPPDVFLIDQQHLPSLIEAGQVQPVDKLLADRQIDFGDGFERDGLEAFAASASLQCMPHDVSPRVVYYNEKLVDLDKLVEQGETPPTAEDGWSWEEFTVAARQASKGKAKGVHFDPDLESLAPFVWSVGADIVDDPQEPTTLVLSEGDTRAALEEVLAVVRDPKLTPTRMELLRQDAVTRFKKGKLGMIFGSRALAPELREAKDLDFDVMPMPSLARYRTIADMSGYCISADTENVQAAADFLAFAIGREGATITAESGYVVPANLEVAHSPAFSMPTRDPEADFVFTEGVRRSQRTPFVPEWTQVDDEVRPLMEKLFWSPVVDLDVLLGEIDTASQTVLAPEVPVEEQ